ncbi:hypothetical protein CLOP_g23287 [Closterium sp. NIES-67]|nr:hypothetical protein CLOP_g23287 [Closterium sp. NIES-67]
MKTIWAYSDGPSTTLDGHAGHRGSTTIDYSCDGTATPPLLPLPPPPSPAPCEYRLPAPPASASPSPPPPSTTPSPPPSSPPAAGVACPASTLDGFDYQVELGGALMLLHWTFASSTSIKFAMEARASTLSKDGWMAVGWSGRKGKMKGSDAVIGNLPGVAAVHMSGYSKKLVKQTSAFSIGTAEVAATTEGGTMITFTREVGTGAVPIVLNATNYLIFAFSSTASKTLAFHAWNQGGLAVDFSCFRKPSSLWGGGPDYSDDSDYDSSFRAASVEDPSAGAALSTSSHQNSLQRQKPLGQQHHNAAVAASGNGLTNAGWWARKSAFWKAIFGG